MELKLEVVHCRCNEPCVHLGRIEEGMGNQPVPTFYASATSLQYVQTDSVNPTGEKAASYVNRTRLTDHRFQQKHNFWPEPCHNPRHTSPRNDLRAFPDM